MTTTTPVSSFVANERLDITDNVAQTGSIILRVLNSTAFVVYSSSALFQPQTPSNSPASAILDLSIAGLNNVSLGEDSVEITLSINTPNNMSVTVCFDYSQKNSAYQRFLSYL